MQFSIAFIGCSLHSGLLNKLAEITQNLIHPLNVFELVGFSVAAGLLTRLGRLMLECTTQGDLL
jgi:hypothetical protein